MIRSLAASKLTSERFQEKLTTTVSAIAATFWFSSPGKSRNCRPERYAGTIPLPISLDASTVGRAWFAMPQAIDRCGCGQAPPLLRADWQRRRSGNRPTPAPSAHRRFRLPLPGRAAPRWSPSGQGVRPGGGGSSRHLVIFVCRRRHKRNPRKSPRLLQRKTALAASHASEHESYFLSPDLLHRPPLPEPLSWHHFVGNVRPHGSLLTRRGLL